MKKKKNIMTCMKGIKNKILTSLIRPYSISKSSNWLNYFDIQHVL